MLLLPSAVLRRPHCSRTVLPAGAWRLSGNPVALVPLDCIGLWQLHLSLSLWSLLLQGLFDCYLFLLKWEIPWHLWLCEKTGSSGDEWQNRGVSVHWLSERPLLRLLSKWVQELLKGVFELYTMACCWFLFRGLWSWLIRDLHEKACRMPGSWEVLAHGNSLLWKGELRIPLSSGSPWRHGPCSPLNAVAHVVLVDGHFSVPNASASEHDGHACQQHDGPGACAEPVPAAEPVPVIQRGAECEQRGHGAAGSAGWRSTGTVHPFSCHFLDFYLYILNSKLHMWSWETLVFEEGVRKDPLSSWLMIWHLLV